MTVPLSRTTNRYHGLCDVDSARHPVPPGPSIRAGSDGGSVSASVSVGASVGVNVSVGVSGAGGSPCACEYTTDVASMLDQAFADAMKFAQDNCGIGVGCFAAEAGAGRCGDLGFVYTSCGEGYLTRQYFDGSGTLRVVDVCSDTTEYCDGSLLCMRHGPDPACAFEAEEDLCQTFDGDQGGGANLH